MVAAPDERARQYTQAPDVTPYVEAAAHYPPLLARMGTEHLVVVSTDELRRELAETVAVTVSMTNNCSYCIGAHTTVFRTTFGKDYDRPSGSSITKGISTQCNLSSVPRSPVTSTTSSLIGVVFCPLYGHTRMNRDDRPDPDGRSALQQLADARTTAVNPNALAFGEASPIAHFPDICENSGATGFDSPGESSR